MSGFNYSKWDNIEISDDEADCHPNIDKSSWFRMKHRSRVEREEKEDAEKKIIVKEQQADRDRIEELAQRLKDEDDEADKEAIEEEVKDLQTMVSQRDARLEEFEQNKKWNVDNMCHVVEERTIVGKTKDNLTSSELPPDLARVQAAKEASRVLSKEAGSASIGPQTETMHVESYADFVERHEELLEAFIHTKSLEDSKNMLHQHGDLLLLEHASSYLLLSCLEEEMNGQHEQMRHVARQSQILSHVSELALSLKRPSRDVVVPFFRRITEPEHKAGFDEAVAGFITRIQKRAVDKRKEMKDEEAANAGQVEEVELTREERMGPGGLDPVEVFETLPKSMQDAFDSKDTKKLQDALSEMPMDQVQYHMKRCEDSGLWVK